MKRVDAMDGELWTGWMQCMESHEQTDMLGYVDNVRVCLSLDRKYHDSCFSTFVYFILIYNDSTVLMISN